MAFELHHIAASIHGRYLVRRPDRPGPAPLLVGFHGYGETAERHLEAIETIPGVSSWLVVAVQALHPFYLQNEVGASWMTRLDRERAIADNIAYVDRVIAEVRRSHETNGTIVCLGFSQGVAMAYRAAVCGAQPCEAVIALAGDVPPEIWEGVRRWPRVLVASGSADRFYTRDLLQRDLAAFGQRGIPVEVVRFTGGHEWGPPFVEAAARLLAELRAR